MIVTRSLQSNPYWKAAIILLCTYLLQVLITHLELSASITSKEPCMGGSNQIKGSIRATQNTTVLYWQSL